eukprot:scaffold15656_cov99-Isochrysis_galbana.AAC.4
MRAYSRSKNGPYRAQTCAAQRGGIRPLPRARELSFLGAGRAAAAAAAARSACDCRNPACRSTSRSTSPGREIRPWNETSSSWEGEKKDSHRRSWGSYSP